MCVDEDECLGYPCHDNATCHNTLGSFECNCNSSYIGDGINCLNQTLCSTEMNCTGDYQKCMFSNNVFECACEVGFQWKNFEKNECIANGLLSVLARFVLLKFTA